MPYGRLLSEIFHQSRLLQRIKDNGSASGKDLGTCTRRILNGRLLGNMSIIDPSKVTILDTDMIESKVMSDLMKDFPPIYREDNPVVIAQVVAQHLFEISVEINWEQIPARANAPLKVMRKRKMQIECDEEEIEEKPKKKQAKKAKATKSVASDIHNEVAELEPAQVLKKRTKGGYSKAASSPKKKKTKISL